MNEHNSDTLAGVPADGTVVTATEVHQPISVQEQAAHAADPAANPLPDHTFIVKPGEPSRLPAGSTLEITPGLHVAHPHAEVNLPGFGDPRVGNTAAVTETVTTGIVKDKDGKDVAVGKVIQKPLADEVRPKTLSAHPDATEVAVRETVPGVLATSQPVKVVLAE